MDYPGRVIKSGEQDARIARALKMQLNRALALQGRNAIRLDPDNPSFGPQMKQAVQMFQARHVDSQDRPLQTDGAVADPAQVQPGMVFIMDFGGEAAHTGFIERVAGGHIAIIEGSTDASRTREGGGVCRLTRKLADVNKGLVDDAGP